LSNQDTTCAYQPAECPNQGKAGIYWFKNYVERCEQHDNAHTVSYVAGHGDTKQSFVRHDIPSGFRRIARDDEALEDCVVSKDHDRHPE